MFCHQCQEAAGNTGCTKVGVCGKTPEVSDLQDLIIYLLKGVSFWGHLGRKHGIKLETADLVLVEGLFTTVTNVNFDDSRMFELINRILTVRDTLKAAVETHLDGTAPNCAVWTPADQNEMQAKALSIGYLSEANADIRSLKALLVLGMKGIAAYADHAAVLQYTSEPIIAFLHKAMSESIRTDIGADELVGLVMEAGEVAVQVMALLDEANTTRFGHPEITACPTSLQDAPGILVSGHDLLDLYELLKQTEGTGIQVYTHGEMLPANAYPELKAFDHMAGHYGGSWWHQRDEFDNFAGAILMTTNCIQKPRDSYADRIFTTGLVGWEDIAHIPARLDGQPKDFSALIAKAKELGNLTPTTGKPLTIGFARNQVMALADKVIEAVQGGAVKRFVVMAGCDGRHGSRDYYTDFAKALPKDSIILTAGCAKFRYNALELGDIGGIPRVLDAGQCNDSYSLAYIALQLKSVLGLDDINDLPIHYNIAWYEQKAVTVLLALLHLGVKGIRLGPTLPAFISPGVANVLVENFGIKTIGTVEDDIRETLESA